MKVNLCLISIIIFLSFSSAFGQTDKQLIKMMPLFENSAPKNYVLPSYPGETNTLHNYICMKLKEAEKELGEHIIGLTKYETYISFTLDEAGKVGDVQLIKKDSNFPKMDQKMVEIVQSMAKWVPFQQDGVAIPIRLGLIVDYNSATANMKFD
jgi:hypothetical protein